MSWPAPFRITALGRDIDLLTTSPIHVHQIIIAHARRHHDILLLCRLVPAAGDQGDLQATLSTYQHGIDWETVRRRLRNNDRRLSPAEWRGLELVATGALWTEEAKWLAGFRGEGSCDACLAAIGTRRHKFHQCDGTHQALTWAQVEGRVGGD